MDELIVGKYGGTSVASYEDLLKIGETTRKDPRRRIIVVSAPNHSNGNKTTNMLLNLANTRDKSQIERILDQYTPLNAPISRQRISNELESRFYSSLEYKAYSANLAALGDEGAAMSVAEVNGFVYIDPKELFCVTPDYCNAKILPISKGLIIEKLGKRINNSDDIFVIAGFSGSTEDGLRATFSRGGSNLTATYIGASLNAYLIENFTDIDGVYSANPNIVKNPRKLERLTFDEMRDLSIAGFKIFNHEAVIPAKLAGIPIEIKSSREPDKTGTYIVSERISSPDEPPIIGVAYRDDLCSIDVTCSGLDDIKGILAKLTNVFASKEIPIEYVPGGIDDQSFIISCTKLEGIDPIGSLKEDLYSIIGEDAEIRFRDSLGSVVVAGKKLNRNRNADDVDIVLRNIFRENNIPIEFSTLGHLKRSLIYGIDNSKGSEAVNLIYERYLR